MFVCKCEGVIERKECLSLCVCVCERERDEEDRMKETLIERMTV